MLGHNDALFSLYGADFILEHFDFAYFACISLASHNIWYWYFGASYYRYSSCLTKRSATRRHYLLYCRFIYDFKSFTELAFTAPSLLSRMPPLPVIHYYRLLAIAALKMLSKMMSDVTLFAAIFAASLHIYVSFPLWFSISTRHFASLRASTYAFISLHHVSAVLLSHRSSAFKPPGQLLHVYVSVALSAQFNGVKFRSLNLLFLAWWFQDFISRHLIDFAPLYSRSCWYAYA